MEIAQFILSLLTVAVVPIILKKMDNQNKHNNKVGMIHTEIEEADMNMSKYSRLLTKETAKAVKDGKANGELTKAIENFDNAFLGLESKKEEALKRLKKEYR